MKVKVESYKIVCDCCGETFHDGNDFVCFSDDPDGGLIRDEALTANWREIDGKHYCPDCWRWDDDDNIQCKDGRKYTENNELIEQPVNPDEMQDGDIISGGECIAIYKDIDREKKYRGTSEAIIYHACTNTVDGHTSIGPKIGIGSFAGVTFHKAYTDERDLLFARLKAKGYRWTGHELIKEG